MVFTDSLLKTQHYGIKGNTIWLGRSKDDVSRVVQHVLFQTVESLETLNN